MGLGVSFSKVGDVVSLVAVSWVLTLLLWVLSLLGWLWWTGEGCGLVCGLELLKSGDRGAVVTTVGIFSAVSWLEVGGLSSLVWVGVRGGHVSE